jgi:cytochrome c oxidase subunit 4
MAYDPALTPHVVARPDEAPADPLTKAHDLAHSHHPRDMHGETHIHVVSVKLLTIIFVILMVLTAVTYAVTAVDLGYQGNLLVAIAIAVVKAFLVCLYFMHLRWDNPFNAICLLTAVLFVGLFIVIASLDTGQYKHLRDQWVNTRTTAAN